MCNPWAVEEDEKWNMRRCHDERAHEIQKMSHIFARHGSGTLDRSAFRKALHGLGLNLSEWEEDTLVHLSDRDNDGHVDAAEFVATMRDFKQSASRIVFGGPKARRSGGVSEALNWTPGPITAFELNLSDREVKKWLRSPLAAASFGL